MLVQPLDLVVDLLVLGERVTTAAAGSTVASCNGAAIHHTIYGTCRTALVLVHGLGCDASFWDAQVAHFRDRVTVVTLDLAGHGRSSSGERSEWTVAAFAEDVAAVADRVGGDEVVLVGHSLGGSVALAAVLRLRARVLGVIAVDALHDLDAGKVRGRAILVP